MQDSPDAAAIAGKMSAIKHKVLVLSGKGGVGKTPLALPPAPAHPLHP